MPEFPAAPIQNNPVYSLPHLYISGLNISAASGTILAIAPGQARDSNDFIDMPVGFPDLQGNTNPATQFLGFLPPLLLNSAVNGANGLDAGTLAASTQYAVYLIGDSRGYLPVAGLISLTSNAYPLLPFGYDSLRLLGFAATTAGTVFSNAGILNMANAHAFYLQPPISEVAGGNAIVFTAVDLASSIPTTTTQNVIAYLLITFIPAAVGDDVQIRPTGSSATTGLPTVVGIAAGVPQQQYLQVICGVAGGQPSIDYKVTSASDSVSISVAGWSVTTS